MIEAHWWGPSSKGWNRNLLYTWRKGYISYFLLVFDMCLWQTSKCTALLGYSATLFMCKSRCKKMPLLWLWANALDTWSNELLPEVGSVVRNLYHLNRLQGWIRQFLDVSGMFSLSLVGDSQVTGRSSFGKRTSKSRTVRSAGAFPFTWTSPTKSFFLPKAQGSVNNYGSSQFISDGKPKFCWSSGLLNWVVPFE